MLRTLAGLGCTIIAGAVVWAYTSVAALQRDLAETRERIHSIEQRLDLKTADRYTANDAKRDHALIAERLDELSRRAARAEARRN